MAFVADEIDRDAIPDSHPVAIMYDLWMQIRSSDDPPYWHAFDPLTAPKILPSIMLLVPEDGGHYRYTLFGESCRTLLGESYKGKRFGEESAPAVTRKRRQMLDAAVERQRPVLSQSRVPVPDRDFLFVYRGLFPFLGNDGGLAKMMVVMGQVDLRRPQIRPRLMVNPVGDSLDWQPQEKRRLLAAG